MSKFEAYYLCVCVNRKNSDDKKSKKDEVTYTVISNQNLSKILKGLTVESMQGFSSVEIFVFFDDKSNIFANYNLTSYVEIDASQKNVIDLAEKTFQGLRVTRVFSVDVTSGKVSRV